jgi:hypothetical protein
VEEERSTHGGMTADQGGNTARSGDEADLLVVVRRVRVRPSSVDFVAAGVGRRNGRWLLGKLGFT